MTSPEGVSPGPIGDRSATFDDPTLPTTGSGHESSPNGPANDTNDNGKEEINPGDCSTGKKTADNNVKAHEEPQEQMLDDFGLPVRVRPRPARSLSTSSDGSDEFHDVHEEDKRNPEVEGPEKQERMAGDENLAAQVDHSDTEKGEEEEEDTAPTPAVVEKAPVSPKGEDTQRADEPTTPTAHAHQPNETFSERPLDGSNVEDATSPAPTHSPSQRRHKVHASEWSHQRLTDQHDAEDSEEEEEEDGDGGWKDMPALGELDFYDDYGRLVAKGAKEEDDEAVYSGLGGAGKGYTRVQLDEDAQSATSMDEDTSYLFKETNGNSAGMEGEELRDQMSQLQATKTLLTESQRIAYVGVTRLAMFQMVREAEKMPSTKQTKRIMQKSEDSLKKWGQSIMARLYHHMDIDAAEQIMIEQLAEHGVQPEDLIRPLMQNSRVKNPLAGDAPENPVSSPSSPSLKQMSRQSLSSEMEKSSELGSPPPYEAHEGEDLPEVRTPSQLPTSDNIDIDLRWTVLCDLFLVLIADSVYDARSRTLLERVGEAMDVSWLQICRFEKRVIDALEMQESADKETWDESEHMENRRKMALKKKYMIMGLATVGGGLVIGLSAGLLAPVIGAGLAAGFTTIGVSGTSAFLGGVGGTALIASGATLTGGTIGMRASHRRTGAVQTFEYRPLHNNKRVNLIVTVSGWMTGKVDDVRLPYSTVDPIMGDIYSVLWEPDMLRSMGDTINILATEALTQGLQQVLGSTILVALMASLQLPIVLTKLSYLIDNPWNVSLARATSAGLILADSLMNNNLGKRPVTLLGFSLGSRLIFSCLKELAEKGAHGLVQNVYLFGSPMVANKDDYLKARSVVAGRFVNGYASNDWILGYLFRATSGGIMRVAGLAPVEGIPGIENIDVTKLVNGHMDYRAAMPRLLREVGWEVLSDEFTEIEDPDPEDHAARQRELIREIDEARKEAELKPEKKRFGLFKRGKLAEKKGWETYDVNRAEGKSPSSGDDSSETNPAGSVLFDIDAIRAELASEAIQVRELDSTLLGYPPEPQTSREECQCHNTTTTTSASSRGDAATRLFLR
ncbi:hypothetical protein ASPZODRAFT_1754981 [Penicilliopsis zonata CBS 506.65]|uniref:DUF726 domain protein n=1 Tax=Penicilliopsis zonata CBS 506.65 TaxID=1073090 RepID=A0A1L9SKF9_9EURO|nr:hypothetical protein ASPZODRAFT_1754981 [Penicilliopsis zonata CBS 506.65]OJJ47700.1 hypothetical protein ASPZODRAFT_1754981 [Penicilliopsis zonata CBS 506.65]